MTAKQPRILISYAREDGRAFARDLRQRLISQYAFSVWQDVTDLEGGKDWWKQIVEAIKSVEHLILVVTPAALQSEVTRKEWRLARQEGVCVKPVLASAMDFQKLPRWMQDTQIIDPEIPEQWNGFIQSLYLTCWVPRVPFMVEDLPGDFVQRPDEFDRLITNLLDEEHGEPVAITAAIRGAGGYGKTTLAKAICHDNRIIEAFDSGILWTTLGENPGDLTHLVEELIYALEGKRHGFTGVDAATAHLVKLLADNKLLIVIDDVWNQAHLKPFMQGGPSCARLITTRDSTTLPFSTKNVDVDGMRRDEAVSLLRAGIPSSEEEALQRLASRLGEWPLLLRLVNGALRARVQDFRQDLQGALSYVNRKLDRHGLTAFDAENAEERDQAVAKTLNLSFGLLYAKQLARYEELAVFPEDLDIPLVTVEKLWSATDKFDDLDTEELCERLGKLSLLLRFDPTTQHIRLHDVMRKYLIQRQGDKLPMLHNQLLEAHHDWDKAPSLWADMPDSEPYLWSHLAYHLVHAGRGFELVETVKDLRYLIAKTFLQNALAVERDLLASESVAPDDTSLRLLRRSFVQSGHILNSCKSLDDLGVALHSRLQHLNNLSPFVEQLEGSLPKAYVTSYHPLPDLPHPALVRTLAGHNGGIMTCAISSNKEFVVAASRESVLKMWDARTGAEKLALKGHVGVVRACAISPDGKFIVSAADDKTLAVWDADSGETLMRLKGHTREVKGCAISADGELIISASRDGTLKVWDIHSIDKPMTLAGHRDWVNDCAISANGKVVSASDDRTLKVWDAHSGTELLTLSGHLRVINGCAISADGKLAVSASRDKTLKIWDTESGAELTTLIGHTDGVSNCAISANAKVVVSASRDKTLKVWDMESGAELMTLWGHTAEVKCCEISMDGKTIISASLDKTLRIWDTESGADLPIPGGHLRGVRACAISADGRLAVSASRDKTLKIWDTESGTERLTLEGHTSLVCGCAISNDGKLIVSASKDGTLKVWDSRKGAELTTLVGHNGRVNDCAFSPDGKLIVSASNDRTVRVWDARSGDERKKLNTRKSARCCAITPDGKFIVVASSRKRLKIYDMRSGTVIRLLKKHARTVRDCTISPDGKLIISASNDKTIRVWNARTGALLYTLEGHTDEVTGVAISPGGGLIASTSFDGTLKVWAVQRQSRFSILGSVGQVQCVCLSTLHMDGPLYDCAWHPDDKRIIAVGDGGVYFLHLVWKDS
jgi:WD40 repeat protein